MTTHPIDTEALSKRAGHIMFTDGPEQPAATAREVCVLLDQLAAAEHRATRAEAQAAIRGRAVAVYQQRAREAEARIANTLALCDEWAAMGTRSMNIGAARRALVGGGNGKITS